MSAKRKPGWSITGILAIISLFLTLLFSTNVVPAKAHYELFTATMPGGRWSEHEVRYEINPARAPSCALEAIKRAAKQWTDVDCSCFTLTCVSQASNRWAREEDGRNVISFCNRTHETIDGRNGTLAITYTWYFPNCTIAETDIHFDSLELWNCTTNCTAPEFHLETVAKHEFGHVAGLRDLYDQRYKEMIMYGYIDECEIKTLTKNDMNGVRRLYPDGMHLHAKAGLIDLHKPVCTQWHGLYPEEIQCKQYHLQNWTDNKDGKLSPCDQIELNETATKEKKWYNVYEVTVTLNVTKKPDLKEWMCIEFVGDIQEFPWKNPNCTPWHEVKPKYCTLYHLQHWNDTDGSGNLTVCDQIWLNKTRTKEKYEYHVEDVATDIYVCPKPPPVGGAVVGPVDKFSLLAPWIVLAVSVAVAAISVVALRKRYGIRNALHRKP